MRPFWLLAALLAAPPALASDYQCRGDRVVREGTTRYTVRTTRDDVTVEKGGLLRGRAVRAGAGYTVEVDGQPVATLQDGLIFTSGVPWATVAEAQRVYDCPDAIAATLWVLAARGLL